MLGSEPDKTLLYTKPFKYLDTHELSKIKAYSRIKKYETNTIIVKQGSLSESMFIILEGTVEVRAKILSNYTMNLTTLEAGNFFGEMSLIKTVSHNATIIAKKPVTCLLLNASYFSMLSVFFPLMHFKILKAITEEISIRLCHLQALFSKNQTILPRSIDSKSKFIKKFTPQALEPTTFQKAHINSAELSQAPALRAFNDDSLKILFQYADLVKVPNHHLLIPENDLSSPFYLIIRGAVQANVELEQRIKLVVLSPVNIFGSPNLLIHQAAPISFITCERAILLMFSQSALKELENSYRDLWFKVFYMIASALLSLELAVDKLLLRLSSETYYR